jgi:hypothetical protein
VTAKEKLRARVEDLSEREAEATLDFIAARGNDSFARWLASRPEDDEPLTSAERDALVESDADIAAGRTVSVDEIRREFGQETG